ncbi:hypothetical protein FOE67_16050 [Streptomyces calidiresistens]|uniref:Uncharacterized protein n=1 Tax=Streptomyces calidiresistens TaxID=1485586 RepID=A0A7W3T4X7_9ACTN|nr:hypothetical protein [Streptomyces calidiresistens]MBB0230987.1 hypothetical protein [Streptomyces calidiresistens]
MIHFASNSTGWNMATNSLVPGGQVDLLITPITTHLPTDTYTVGRQPRPDAINVYLSNRDRYLPASWRLDRIGISYAHGIASKGYRRWQTTSSFDFVTCPGPAHTREVIASGAPPDRVIEIGYPKLDPLFRGDIVDDGSVWAPDDRIRVLYAPTHGGGSEAYAHGNRDAPGAKATSWWDRQHVLGLLDPATFQVVLAPVSYTRLTLPTKLQV